MRQSTFPTTEFQWHANVHEEWAGEYLVFLFLRFRPTYDRKAVVSGLQRFLAGARVLSYSLYEISGPYDVMLRAWVPNDLRKPRLKKALGEFWQGLGPPRPEVRAALEVTEIVHHWPWQTHDSAPIGAMRSPEEQVIDEGRPLRELAQLNALQQMARRLRGGVVPVPEDGEADLEALPNPAEGERLVGEYQAERLLTMPPYQDGVRFISLVEATGAPSEDDLGMLQQSLGDLLDQAQNEPHKPAGRIWDRSLYATDGEYRFLILGRVDDSAANFHSISEGLLTKINESLRARGARTETSYVQLPGFLDFRDELRLRRPPPPEGEGLASEVLRRHESQTFEVKASVFTELDGHFKRGEEPRRDKEIDNKALSSFLRAVASMLNGPEGGQIVIGAVEPQAYRRSELVAALPESGNYRICGIEADGYDGKNWDHYARQIDEVLETRIVPSPLTWISVDPLPAGDRMVCLVTVSLPDEWFAVRMGKAEGPAEEQFFIRGGGSGARTERLRSLSEIDAHKARVRRAPRYVRPRGA